MFRKPGKLPRPTHAASYALEYGTNTLHLHTDAFVREDRVVLVDDLVATGGTLAAAVDLTRRTGATLLETAAVIELEGLGGRARLPADVGLHALVRY